MRSPAQHSPRLDVRWNDALQRRVEVLRRRVIGTTRPAHKGFGIEGVFIEDAMQLIIYGEVTADTIPRLETVLEGLLVLHPAQLVVHLDQTRTLDDDASRWIAERQNDFVRFVEPEPDLSPVITAEHDAPVCGRLASTDDQHKEGSGRVGHRA